MILIHDIRLPLSAGEPQAYEKALRLARIPRGKVSHLGIARLSVDARHGQPKLVYTVAVTLKEEREEAACAGASRSVTVRGKTDFSVQNGTLPLTHRPVVCGLGPAGLFAALLLARQGYRPIVLERGPALDERVGIQTTDGAFPCEALVFAVGHSARDTFGMLMDSGLVLECKPFSVGFRAEHLQSEIEKSLYHEAAGHPALPRGEYQLSQHVEKRCVYTFCMCPGGQVVASASEKGRVVTNGMSYHARSGRNANAAVVVSVGGEDFGNDPRKAIAFQRELEARAYAAGRPGGEYAAPAENIQSFLEGRGRLNIGRVQPTYDRGVVAADLGALLPTELADTLRAGLRAYERKIAGYTAPEAILTGLETRTSSPVRLKREENFECAQLAGLYPCGEGAGYAGGIMSAAVDGLRVARAIISRYSPAEG